MDILIRHVEPRDADASRELHGQPEAVWGTLQVPFPTEEMWKKRIDTLPEGSVSLVAEVDSRIVGQAAIFVHTKSPRRKHSATIGIAVHRDWMGQGVGTALIGALVDLSDNWLNLKRIELT
ncbi:MAG: GNAT family N-acetyltransferase, partial [Planctomycetales bacterium]|nr:GNAT family N-acetyltransferase [Planctomycetales bacterium]